MKWEIDVNKRIFLIDSDKRQICITFDEFANFHRELLQTIDWMHVIKRDLDRFLPESLSEDKL